MRIPFLLLVAEVFFVSWFAVTPLVQPALAHSLSSERFVERWQDSEFHDSKFKAFEKDFQLLQRKLLQRNPKLFDPNVLTCDICKPIANASWFLLQDGGENYHLVQWFANVACLEAFNPTDANICEDVVDGLMEVAHLGLQYTMQFHFNYTVLFCADLLKVCTVDCCLTNNLPEQVHLSFTGGDALQSSTMQVSWVSRLQTEGPLVQWWVKGTGASGNRSLAQGESRTYTSAGWRGWVHGAVMTGLIPDTEYTYTVGSIDSGWSKEYNFRTLPLNAGTEGRPLRVVALADMGVGGDHDQTLADLRQYVADGSIDLILHTGDISYADGDDYRWDRFMREMEPIAARVPYMTAPGNHEALWNFSAYKHRFYMPAAGHGAPTDAMYYSFSVGQFRFVHMDTETWWDTPRMDPVQVNWADRVLKEARDQNQFIWVGFHRPLYCTTPGGFTCNVYSEFLRAHIESVLYEHRVAIIHTGHVHNYERTLQVYNGSAVVPTSNYTLLQAPLNYVNGAAGCIEGISEFGNVPNRPDWSADRISKTGYLLMTMYHTTSSSSAEAKGDKGAAASTLFHVKSQFVLSGNQTVADEVTLTQQV